jgi:pyruvate-ferredoxin/flavodoxin oxidoreductase
LISVHLYRPFSSKYFFNVFLQSVKKITVLDRTKEIGAPGEPLYLDIKDMFYDRQVRPVIIGGRYGLSSKDTTPSQILSVFENMKLAEPKNLFTVGIVDDVTFKSLPILPEINVALPGTYSAKFYGLGSDGTVGANKNSIKIIGDTLTNIARLILHMIQKNQEVLQHHTCVLGINRYVHPILSIRPILLHAMYHHILINMICSKALRKKERFLLNSIWDNEETKKRLPDHMKKYMAEQYQFLHNQCNCHS